MNTDLYLCVSNGLVRPWHYWEAFSKVDYDIRSEFDSFEDFAKECLVPYDKSQEEN